MITVYLLGAPATGKSTLMAGLHRELGLTRHGQVDLNGLLRGDALRMDGEPIGVELGRYREGGFPGTDCLARDVGPDAMAWATGMPLPPFILGEGHRLGYPAFLEALALRTRLVVVHLHAADGALAQRCADRGAGPQAPSYRKGCATRSARAADHVADLADVLRYDTTDMGVLPKALQEVVEKVSGYGL